MNAVPIPYVNKNPLSSGDPQEPLTFAGGLNNTAVEQSTSNSEFTASQNMFTDATGGIYVRNGSKLLGGIASGEPCYGVFQFKDNFQNQIMLAVFGKVLCYLLAGSWIPVPGAPVFTGRLICAGAFYPDVNSYVIANGVDPTVVVTLTGTVPSASAPANVPLATRLMYYANHMLYMGAPATPNAFFISDLAVLTSASRISFVALNGKIMCGAPLSLSMGLIITSERCYRFSGVPVSVTDANGVPSYAFTSIEDLGSSACVAPNSIAVVNQAAYWIGGDAQNGFEVYRCDGHQIIQIAGLKMKYYQQFVSAAQVSNAAGVKYGSYYKVSLNSLSVSGGSQEWLIDTFRSGFFYYNLSQLNVVCEGNHLPGHYVANYAYYEEGGKTYTVAADAVNGCVHRQGLGYQDELVTVSRIGLPNAQFVTVGLQNYFSQPIPAGLVLSTVSLRAGTLTAGSKLTVSVQLLVNGSPSGVPILSSALAQATWSASPTQMPSAVVSVSFSTPVTVPTGCVLVFSADSAWSLQTLPGQSPEGAALSLSSLSFVSQTWIPSAVQLAFSLGTLIPITASVTKTTCLGNPHSKKRTVQMVVTGQSILGSTPLLGIGTLGRDSQFTSKPLNFSGRGGTWAATATSPTPPALQFATDPTHPTNNQVWGSTSSSFSQTVFAPMYVPPSVYVSYRFACTGTTDWRISSFVPIFETYPSTLV